MSRLSVVMTDPALLEAFAVSTAALARAGSISDIYPSGACSTRLFQWEGDPKNDQFLCEDARSKAAHLLYWAVGVASGYSLTTQDYELVTRGLTWMQAHQDKTGNFPQMAANVDSSGSPDPTGDGGQLHSVALLASQVLLMVKFCKDAGVCTDLRNRYEGFFRRMAVWLTNSTQISTSNNNSGNYFDYGHRRCLLGAAAALLGELAGSATLGDLADAWIEDYQRRSQQFAGHTVYVMPNYPANSQNNNASAEAAGQVVPPGNPKPLGYTGAGATQYDGSGTPAAYTGAYTFSAAGCIPEYVDDKATNWQMTSAYSYTDLTLVAGNQVSSAARPFQSADVNSYLHFLAPNTLAKVRTGWYWTLAKVTAVRNGVATLDRKVGQPGKAVANGIATLGTIPNTLIGTLGVDFYEPQRQAFDSSYLAVGGVMACALYEIMPNSTRLRAALKDILSGITSLLLLRTNGIGAVAEAGSCRVGIGSNQFGNLKHQDGVNTVECLLWLAYILNSLPAYTAGVQYAEWKGYLAPGQAAVHAAGFAARRSASYAPLVRDGVGGV